MTRHQGRSARPGALLAILARLANRLEIESNPRAVGSRQEGTFNPYSVRWRGLQRAGTPCSHRIILPGVSHATNAPEGSQGSGSKGRAGQGRRRDYY